MTDLESTLTDAKAREVEAVRRVQAQIAVCAPYAENDHPIPKHPAPGCSCLGCAGRDAREEERAEKRTEDRMTGREADRRADIYFGDLT